MSTYHVTAPDGRKLKLVGDAPPTEAELEEIFASTAPPSDPRGMMGASGPAGRSGAQILTPKNPRAMLGALSDAANVAGELPGAVGSVLGDYTSGALKGLGRIAAPAVKAVGLGNEYTDTALAPQNDLESYAGTGAQIGAGVLASGAAAALGAGTGLFPAVVRAATHPVSIGVGTGVATKAAGGSTHDAIQSGMIAGGLGWRGRVKPIPMKPIPAPPKATIEQMKAAVEAGPRGAAAKAAMRAEKAAVQAPKPAPQPAPTAPNPPAKPSTVAITARDVDSALGSLSKSSQARLKHVVQQAKKENPNAGTFADDVAARAARQKEHIAESVAKREAKDAANVAKEKNLLSELEDSADLLKNYPKRGGESNSQWMRRVQKALEEPKKSAQDIANDLAERVQTLSREHGMSRAQIKDILRENHGIPPSYGSQLINIVLGAK